MNTKLALVLLLLNPLIGFSQQWQLISPMPNARASFAMSQIHNDTLIFIGGRNGSGVNKPCDLFSISTQSWTPTGSLNISRQNMPSVVLQDGNVYVPSGLVDLDDEMTATSEIYNRGTRKWSFTTSVLEAREANPAMLLPSGKVLIPAGALAPFGPYRNTCELYDPVTKEQTFTDNITQGQFGNLIFLNPDNKKITLISDHYNGANGVWVDHTEEYDIASGKWTLVAHSEEPHGCWMDQAVQLPNGEIVAPSGGKAPNTASELVEIYNPISKTWRTAGKLPHPRYLAASVYLGGDSIMVIGGYEPSSGKALRECTIFNVATGSSRSGPLLNESRYFHRTFVHRKRDIENPCCEQLKIYVFGGEDETGTARSSCEVLTVKAGGESPLSFTPSLSLQGSVCDGIDTTITFKNIGCSGVVVDSVKVEGFEGTATGLPKIVGLDEELSVPLTLSSNVSGSIDGRVRIFYRSTCSRLDTSIAITANFSASTKGTIRPIISDVPNGSTTVEMPLYLVNNSGDIFNAFEIELGFDNDLLEALPPRFDGTLAEGAPLADVTATASGATIFVPQTIALSVSKPLCILRFTSHLADTTCTTVRLEGVRLEDEEGNNCIYAVRKDSAIICKALSSVRPDERPSCAPFISDFVVDREALRFTADGCSNTVTVNVFDILGKQVYSGSATVGVEQQVPTSHLTAGFNSLVIRNEYGLAVKKILLMQR